MSMKECIRTTLDSRSLCMAPYLFLELVPSHRSKTLQYGAIKKPSAVLKYRCWVGRFGNRNRFNCLYSSGIKSQILNSVLFWVKPNFV